MGRAIGYGSPGWFSQAWGVVDNIDIGGKGAGTQRGSCGILGSSNIFSIYRRVFVLAHSLEHLWPVYGLSMVYLWSIYGLSYGLSMVYLRFFHVFRFCVREEGKIFFPFNKRDMPETYKNLRYTIDRP